MKKKHCRISFLASLFSSVDPVEDVLLEPHVPFLSAEYQAADFRIVLLSMKEM